MDTARKNIKESIHSYFLKEKVKHMVRVFAYGKHQMIDVEYEDFLSEEHVIENIRSIVGPDFLINVKRECSDEMLMEIHLYNMTTCERTKKPKTIYEAKVAVQNLIPRYEHSWISLVKIRLPG